MGELGSPMLQIAPRAHYPPNVPGVRPYLGMLGSLRRDYINSHRSRGVVYYYPPPKNATDHHFRGRHVAVRYEENAPSFGGASLYRRINTDDARTARYRYQGDSMLPQQGK